MAAATASLSGTSSSKALTLSGNASSGVTAARIRVLVAKQKLASLGGGGVVESLRVLDATRMRPVRQVFQCQAQSVDVGNGEKDDASPTGDSDFGSLNLESRRGLEERFAVLNTGISECTSCGYVYDQTVGDKNYPVAAGTEFRSLPEDWLCPTCGAAKSYFKSKSIEVAGFAQNQNYGLGGNSLTAGQKSLLIYGSLAFFFALFLSGYFLQ